MCTAVTPSGGITYSLKLGPTDTATLTATPQAWMQYSEKLMITRQKNFSPNIKL